MGQRAGPSAPDCPYDRARALGDLGRALIAAGEATAARAAVAAALDLCAGLTARLGDPDLQRSFQVSELPRQLQATWRVVTALA